MTKRQENIIGTTGPQSKCFSFLKSKEAEELEENSDAVIVVKYLEENNAIEEEENHEVVKEPIDSSEEATSRAVSDCFRGSK